MMLPFREDSENWHYAAQGLERYQVAGSLGSRVRGEHPQDRSVTPYPWPSLNYELHD